MADEGAPDIAAIIEAAAADNDSDILLLNAPMANGLEQALRAQVCGRSAKRDKLIVLLVTTGGLADEAYRCARLLQASYRHITICVAGWCKSAGTLLAIGGHDLMIGPRGELGPLDVQITKRDELFDRDSGLISNAALDRLRAESFQFFEDFMLQIIARSQNAITFRTAADVAAEVTVGLMGPIFDKIDPLRLGADSRAMDIGSAYAMRLNMVSENLKSVETLNMLLNGYPSHSFVIDYTEAEMLFTRVKPLPSSIELLVEALGSLTTVPRDEALVCFIEGAGNGKGKDESGTADQAAENEAGAPANDAGNAGNEPPEVLRAALQEDARPSRKSRPRGLTGLSG